MYNHLDFSFLRRKTKKAPRYEMLSFEVASGLEPLCPVLQTGD